MPIIAEVIPQGFEAVNGSDNITMGCSGKIYHCGELRVCAGYNITSPFTSYLSNRDRDDHDTIDTNDENWASKLVTVKKKKSDVHDFPHVLLTFAFEYAVLPESVEMELFLCDYLQIGAPYITLFGDNYTDLVYRGFKHDNEDKNSDFIVNHLPDKKSCDHLLNISLKPQRGEPCHYNWHILVSFFNKSIEWVRIGEVRFNISETDLYPESKHPFVTGENYTL